MTRLVQYIIILAVSVILVTSAVRCMFNAAEQWAEKTGGILQIEQALKR